MITTMQQRAVTFSATSSDAVAATEYVSDAILAYARDNNSSVVSVSHAMIQQGELIQVTAIAVFLSGDGMSTK